ncbi:sensor histidine kinase [Uliginosibacterium flavum]|uniref:histidine kinase n=1 Tax=Uliginosibacterium flavum TaxID=1396831 RepID=A0ABV2TRR0_9RHOO
MPERSAVSSATFLSAIRAALAAVFISSLALLVSRGVSVQGVLWCAVSCAGLIVIGVLLDRYRSSLEAENLAEDAQAVSPLQREGEFLSSLGHDLRQPAQAISLFAATLSAHPLPESSRKLVTGIEAAVQQLSEQLEAVFNIAKVEAGQFECHLTPVGLEDVFALAVANQLDEAHERQLHLRRVTTARHVIADEALLLRTIDRMLAHALSITKEGGVVLGCRQRGAVVVIEVWDSSEGIAAEILPAVFVPGSVYGQQLADRGLGLVLARRLATLMGGHVSISSVLGRGCILRLTLPLVSAPTSA